MSQQTDLFSQVERRAVDEARSLYEQIDLGHRAQRAKEGYLEGFIERVRLNILGQICSIKTSDHDTLISLKHALDAINALEVTIDQDIESGRLAAIQVNNKGKDNVE